ncbi:MAG: dihydroxyacetone kinase subunit L [Eubacteriales bacterium]|nr:dihydroxyacetone kinase subunit L [Eubacteriales bacterium]
MNTAGLAEVFDKISEKITANKDYLVELDQQAGDGDLGIYMDAGYRAAAEFLKTCGIDDLGMAMNKTANVFNENAPSSLGTVTSFIMKGMAKSLKGKENADQKELAEAIIKGLENVTEKTGSKQGQKTILDSLYPGAEALLNNADKGIKEAAELAKTAAAGGSKAAGNLKAVWGRAAYFGEKSIGLLDGGAETGRLIFEGIADWAKE